MNRHSLVMKKLRIFAHPVPLIKSRLYGDRSQLVSMLEPKNSVCLLRSKNCRHWVVYSLLENRADSRIQDIEPGLVPNFVEFVIRPIISTFK